MSDWIKVTHNKADKGTLPDERYYQRILVTRKHKASGVKYVDLVSYDPLMAVYLELFDPPKFFPGFFTTDSRHTTSCTIDDVIAWKPLPEPAEWDLDEEEDDE